VTSQQSVRQAARRSALNAQALLRKQRADRERRLEALAVEMLTALGERDGAVRDAELRAGRAQLAIRACPCGKRLKWTAAAPQCGK
jgi:hypothetical protein